MKGLKGIKKLAFVLTVLSVFGFSNRVMAAGAVYSASTVDEARQVVQKILSNHETDSVVSVNGSDAFNALVQFPAVDNQYMDDYSEVSVTSFGYSAKRYSNHYDVSMKVSYVETEDQENYVDSKVKSILPTIINGNMTQIQKEKAIHDWIVKNVKYDSSLTDHSDYGALVKGTTVCQGYSLLAYKMLSAAGINSKIVVGGNHAWNMVYVSGKWYHLDVTYDDPVPDQGNKVFYTYFNKTDAEMRHDHSWDASKYPAAINSFNTNSNSADWSQKDYLSGWVSDSTGSKYYVNQTAITGWFSDSINWYFFGADGIMKKGWISDNGKWYFLNTQGKMLCNTVTPDGYRVGADGSWIPW